MSEQILTHGNMLMKYKGAAGEALRMCSLSTENTKALSEATSSAPNFSLEIAGDETAPMQGCASLASHYEGARCTFFEHSSKGLTAKYIAYSDMLEITVKMQFIPGTDVVRQVNSVKNIGNEKVTITHFGSGFLCGIGQGGLKKWYLESSKLKVHHCLSHWQGEAQWRTDTLENLGIYKKTAHSWDSTAWRARSVGSWSTGKNYPLVILENTETGTVWYMELECGTSWTVELGNRNGSGESEGTFYLEANSADEETGFVKVLHPGKSYTACPVLFGCTDGSFEEAVKQLTKAKRKTTLASWKNGAAPAFFNTYMDCVWGAGDKDTLPTLIQSASDCGAEVFCLDAGWYIKGLGEWSVNNEKYGVNGLKGIFDLIKSKGMKPGAWLEIESISPDTPMYKNGRLLARNAKAVSGGHFADFTDKYQRDYIEGIFDMLYDMGVRFIKNDYNRSVMYGANMSGSSAAEGLKKHTEAFYSLIDSIRKKYPDLMIENCGSGAMRSDTGTLRHFHLQSASDQEFYYLNPSIISGTAACLAPEKAGIWSYPYPVSFYENQKGADVYADASRMADLADGEQTVFNMVNALCGTLYLSGRIDKADSFNASLIKEGVEVYKKYRQHIASAYPVWPDGTLKIGDRTHSSLGFISENGKKMTLAVWKLEDMSEVIEVDLSKYFAGKKAKVQIAYPTLIGTDFVYNQNTAKLCVKMPKDRTARFFEITV